MIFGHARIPIMNWMRQQAAESLLHATQAGEEVTTLGARLSLGIGYLAGTHHESVDDIMQELLVHERRGIERTKPKSKTPARIPILVLSGSPP